MYRLPYYREERPEVIEALIREHSFAALVGNGPSGLLATHVPLLLDRGRGEHGTLFGHMARRNPQWNELAPGSPVLAIFSGPNAYVSPRFYEAVPDVPTWNYIGVHVHGSFRLVDDHAAIRDVLERTITRYEEGRERPWSLPEALPARVDRLLGGVVAFEIAIERAFATVKLSQDKTPPDKWGVIRGLERGNTEEQQTAAQMRRLLEVAPDAEPT